MGDAMKVDSGKCPDNSVNECPSGRAGVEWAATIWRPLAAQLVDVSKRYQIIAHPAQEALAKRFADAYPGKFTYHATQWGKFKDGTDNIEVGGFYPENHIRGQNVMLFASFHDNNSTFSQFHVMNMLCESFLETMTVVLPYYPTGGMERVDNEGQVATANTLARLFSNLPRLGKPVRVMVYDLHTLQNRFYLSGNALATLHTAVPLLISVLKSPESKINCLAFPDEGACKRFKGLFEPAFPDWAVVTCGKLRDGDKRHITIQDGNPKDLHCIIIDDVVHTGNTIAGCARRLKEAGAASVSAYVTHAVLPEGWDMFLRANDGPLDKFFVTNSNPTVTDKLPGDEAFQVLDLFDVICQDLE